MTLFSKRHTFIKNSDISKKQNNPKTNNNIYNVFLSVKQKYHILKMITARLLTKWHLILNQQINHVKYVNSDHKSDFFL